MTKLLSGLLRRLTADDLVPAADLLSRAFFEDPFWTYLQPDLKKRERHMVQFYRMSMRVGIRNRAAFGTGEPLQGVALWELPREEGASRVGNLSYYRMLFSPLIAITYRALPFFTKAAELRERFVPGPRYYLESIGVDPRSHGRGLASDLIRPFMERADRRSLPCYMETVNPANVPLYEHYGFRVVDHSIVPGTSLYLWSLLHLPSKEAIEPHGYRDDTPTIGSATR